MAEVSFPGVTFAEAIAFLRDRLGLSEAEWQALFDRSDAASAAIADQTVEDMRREFIEAVLATIEQGGTLADFRDRYDDIVAAYGWESPRGAGWHAELVFRVQTGLATAAGRWEQIQKVKLLRPYVRYVTMGDHKVRPEHRLWHNIVLPVDDPFWLSHWPPNGFNCRCTVQSLNGRDLDRYGFTLTPDSDPTLSLPPDAGWAGNAGIAWEALKAS